MPSTRTLFILITICFAVLLGFGTLAQGGQDRVFERDGTRLYGAVSSVDGAKVVIGGKIVERSQVAMIVFDGAMVPTAEPTSSQQSGGGKTDLVEMRDGSRKYGRVSSVSANLVVQNGAQLPRSKVGVIEFDVNPPSDILTVEPNEATPTPTPSAKASPPAGYIPAQEKPSDATPQPPPTGNSPAEEKAPAPESKKPPTPARPRTPSSAGAKSRSGARKPTPNFQCKSLADFQPATPDCVKPGKVEFRDSAIAYGWIDANRESHYYGDGKVVISANFLVCGAWISESSEPISPSTAGWSESFMAEMKKKNGMPVCCGKPCQPAKTDPNCDEELKRLRGAMRGLAEAAKAHEKSYKEAEEKRLKARDAIYGVDGTLFKFSNALLGLASKGGEEEWQEVLSKISSSVTWVQEPGLLHSLGVATEFPESFAPSYAQLVDHANREANNYYATTRDLGGAQRKYLSELKAASESSEAVGALLNVLSIGIAMRDYRDECKHLTHGVSDYFEAKAEADEAKEAWDKADKQMAEIQAKIDALLAQCPGAGTHKSGGRLAHARRVRLAFLPAGKPGTLELDRVVMDKLKHLELMVKSTDERIGKSMVPPLLPFITRRWRTVNPELLAGLIKAVDPERRAVLNEVKEESLLGRDIQGTMQSSRPSSQSATEIIGGRDSNKANSTVSGGDTARTITTKAETYFSQERYPQAVEAYKEALRLNPNNAKAQNGLGSAYYKMDKYEDAIEAFKLGLRVNPNEAVAQSRLGAAYGELGRYEEAVAPLREAIRLDPKDYIAYYNLGQVYLHLGDRDGALRSYRILKVNRPDLAKMLYRDINQ